LSGEKRKAIFRFLASFSVNYKAIHSKPTGSSSYFSYAMVEAWSDVLTLGWGPIQTLTVYRFAHLVLS